MKKRPSRLTLHRETLRHLNERSLQRTPAGNVIPVINDTKQLECYSPLCVPTYWKGCQETV
jgi:hypothetical protein